MKKKIKESKSYEIKREKEKERERKREGREIIEQRRFYKQ